MSVDEQQGAMAPVAYARHVGALCLRVDDGAGPGTVSLAGELDLASAPALAGALAGVIQAGHDVTLDLRELQFIDSTGIGVLVRARNHAERAGLGLTLCAPRANVVRTLELTGLRTVFVIER